MPKSSPKKGSPKKKNKAKPEATGSEKRLASSPADKEGAITRKKSKGSQSMQLESGQRQIVDMLDKQNKGNAG